MPTLFRFVIILLFLTLLAFGSMFALTIFVEPQQKEETIRVPMRDIFDKN